MDVGAGIGRVTSSVLLHLLQDIVLLEPVDHFVNEAYIRVSASEHVSGEWKGVKDAQKSVTVVQSTLQEFDPKKPISAENYKILGRVGYNPPGDQDDSSSGFDVVWCQWCLGHLSDEDLVAFLKRAKESLRSVKKGTGDFEGLIVVKENTCSEQGAPRTVFDEQDSSVTR